jgi:hypothetical protein
VATLGALCVGPQRPSLAVPVSGQRLGLAL